ncbi:DEAD-domain-containing protein [Aspergillus ellipticus CBS 707.79]|uniref:ATP-dependent RNA helicase n=1 Tax=Aspergillus ellipticus CBS 707.79 TaxID=1448320 RepID=A0A319E9Y4_9EURO|nr:DEAD-domain-containing protein [Aspergillus ellipticus CBS 707.79]
MLGAFRRNGVVHALRASRSLLARPTAQKTQWLAPSAPVVPRTVRALYHPSPVRFQSFEDSSAQPTEAKPEPEQFADLGAQGILDPSIVRVITNKMNIKTMTEVQSKTLREALNGEDVLAQAKTGTGKTLAFLVPIIQNILHSKDLNIAKQSASRVRRQASSTDIRAIVISPTRELAEQIAVEAKRLTMDSGLVVQTAVGGTNKREHLQRTKREGCHILVGTPGRLFDLLSDPYSNVEAPNLSSLVFDEADRLLDAGFSKEIKDIQELLPDPTKVERQTLMFSATVPHEVLDVVRMTMKPAFKYINTVRNDEPPTHFRVPQKVVCLEGYENALPAVLELVQTHMETKPNKPFKAILYFNSTLHTSLCYSTFQRLRVDPADFRSPHPLGRLPLSEIHGRLTQAQRTSVTERFRKSPSGMLFSSDVTARGLDFPDVTHVIQIGTPRDRESYIHRVGRTGRAGKEGEGWLFIHKGEKRSSDRLLEGLPINQDTSLEAAVADMRSDVLADATALPSVQQVRGSVDSISRDLKVEAWKAFSNSVPGSFYTPDKNALEAVNDFAIYGLGLPVAPRLSALVEGKLTKGGDRQGDSYGGRNSRGRSNYGGRGSRGDGYGGRGDGYGRGVARGGFSRNRDFNYPRSGGGGYGRDDRASGFSRSERDRSNYGGSSDRHGYGPRRSAFDNYDF